LVPTLANYLLRKNAAGAHTDQLDADGNSNAAPAKRSRNPLLRFQQGLDSRFEALRSANSDLLQCGLRNRAKLVAGFLGFTLISFGLAPYLGEDFFPNVDGGQIKMHMRALTGARIEETAKLAD